MADEPPAYDYTGHEELPAPDQLAQLHRLVDQLEQREREVDRLTELLKVQAEAARKLREGDVPDLMQAMGMKDFTSTSGLRVQLRQEVRASLPKDPAKREQAFAWLKAHKHDGLIKRSFVIKFGKDEEAWATKFEADLRKRKKPVNVLRVDDIHNQTLCAFLREQIREGTGIPLPAFGAFIQKFAKIERDPG